jgi:hypothetical protein
VKREKLESEKVKNQPTKPTTKPPTKPPTMTTTINYDPEWVAQVKTKPSTMKKKKSGNQELREKDPMFTPAHQAYIASLKDRIAEMESHLSGKPGNSILSEAEHLTTRDRNDSYGHPSHDYGRVSAAFNSLTGHRLTTEDAILFMVCVKLAREAYKPKRDNRVDAAGYLNCLDMAIQARDQGYEFTTGSQPGRPVAAGLHGAGETEKDWPSVPVGTLGK